MVAACGKQKFQLNDIVARLARQMSGGFIIIIHFETEIETTTIFLHELTSQPSKREAIHFLHRRSSVLSIKIA